jgi:hypothetical protein
VVVGIIGSGVMIGVEDLVKIKPAKHASQSPDPHYSYAYTWKYWVLMIRWGIYACEHSTTEFSSK